MKIDWDEFDTMVNRILTICASLVLLAMMVALTIGIYSLALTHVK